MFCQRCAPSCTERRNTSGPCIWKPPGHQQPCTTTPISCRRTHRRADRRVVRMAIASPESSSREETDSHITETSLTFIKPAAPASPQVLRPNMGGNAYWWEELEGATDQQDAGEGEELSREEVDELVEDTAAFINVLDDIQPLDKRRYNAFAEVWRRIVRIPAEHRHRLLDEIGPGAIRSLWKASMSRYILDDQRAVGLLSGFSLGQEFPVTPGEVYEYLGRWEHVRMALPEQKFERDDRFSRYPLSQPWLRPARAKLQTTTKTFRQLFFMHPRTQELHSRVVLPLVGPIDCWWWPCYCRVRVGLTLTPVEKDAGADMTFEYTCFGAPSSAAKAEPPQVADSGQEGSESVSNNTDADSADGSRSAAEQQGLAWFVSKEDLPVAGWPAMSLAASFGSPIAGADRDFVRLVAPGVYVGCAYPPAVFDGSKSQDNCVYFMLVRKPS